MCFLLRPTYAPRQRHREPRADVRPRCRALSAPAAETTFQRGGTTMPDDKGLNRGGTLGQQGELDDDESAARDLQRGMQGDKLDKRNQEKQRGGIGREPSLEDKQKIQPKHEVD